MRLPPQLPMGLPRPRPPVPRAAVGEGLSAAALSTVWGSGSCLGDWRREAAGVSRWLRQSPRAGWTPAVRPPCGGQGGGLRGSSAPTASRSPTHSHLGRTPGTRGSGRSVGAECGGSAQGIVGESPPASRPCEEGPVQALELHPSARPPTSGQERAHPALSSERTNKAAQLNVNNMFAQSLRWNAHAGLTQLGSGRAVERGLRVRERRAGGPRTPGPGPGGDPGREPSLPLRLALCPQGRSGGATRPEAVGTGPRCLQAGAGRGPGSPAPSPSGPLQRAGSGAGPLCLTSCVASSLSGHSVGPQHRSI